MPVTIFVRDRLEAPTLFDGITVGEALEYMRGVYRVENGHLCFYNSPMEKLHYSLILDHNTQDLVMFIDFKGSRKVCVKFRILFGFPGHFAIFTSFAFTLKPIL